VPSFSRNAALALADFAGVARPLVRVLRLPGLGAGPSQAPQSRAERMKVNPRCAPRAQGAPDEEEAAGGLGDLA